MNHAVNPLGTYKEPRALSPSEIIREQCSKCRHFDVDHIECHFAVEYGWGETNDIDWYRENDPDAIAITQDCLVFPLTKKEPATAPEFNQQ